MSVICRQCLKVQELVHLAVQGKNQGVSMFVIIIAGYASKLLKKSLPNLSFNSSMIRESNLPWMSPENKLENLGLSPIESSNQQLESFIIKMSPTNSDHNLQKVNNSDKLLIINSVKSQIRPVYLKSLMKTVNDNSFLPKNVREQFERLPKTSPLPIEFRPAK